MSEVTLCAHVSSTPFELIIRDITKPVVLYAVASLDFLPGIAYPPLF